MQLADVYHKYPITIRRAKDCYLWTDKDRQILDFYSGHGVISIGHQNPFFTEKLQEQMNALSYYSNAVHLDQQSEALRAFQEVSCLESDYQVFFSNSGAEANENALKAAAFTNNRRKIVAFRNGFHGRTSLAVQCTDNPKLLSSLNQDVPVSFVDLNNFEQADEAINEQVAAVIIEGIQGIGGIHCPNPEFLQWLQKKCHDTGAVLILDEVQSGFGRSGKFLAFQHAGIEPDIFTCAKGMGNGFPVGATFIKPEITLKKGDLGSTFGGNPVACRAAQSVAEYIGDHDLMANSWELGEFLKKELQQIPQVKEVRGHGLMIGIDFDRNATASLRSYLLENHHILCGSAKSPETIRLLPPLTINKTQCGHFLEALEDSIKQAE
ncbi:aspartate aminotransferase family protein [Pseudobacteriovorax antillogorgiicola]|uniref:Acetylornithine aminotransferase n=1 Tax=Pseudobacteriovorax antillogorgiicola TaxID=1513793 RepID=A0A1Y6C7H8_9BACT|nr:aminotransferase class III-fold pyridoxal phosphate-dependent enzyme [Pseudobacteriovorax antillogorgiicola]TCS51687.1 acetylornithine aminotransferase [Pseudobacteriovorax antillogorgiicola]SMF49089.1 acetylornithine aminotransferase [Pseudobacteriovorax antillogorgiicola]